jgi:hypothetical protein
MGAGEFCLTWYDVCFALILIIAFRLAAFTATPSDTWAA